MVVKKKKSLPWMPVLKGVMGVKETRGKKNNPVIMGWAKVIGGSVRKQFYGDIVPWCGLIMGWTFVMVGCKIPKTPLWAKSWKNWGFGLLYPRVGCVGVFNRKGGGGHVAIIIGCTTKTKGKGYYFVQGGNQSDKVSIMRIARKRCIAWRWPSEMRKLLPKEGLPVIKNIKGATVSVNEA